MVKVYSNGNEFINDNEEIFAKDRYLSCFFKLDAPLLTETNNINYAVKVSNGDKYLLAMKVEPYNLMFFGDCECVAEFMQFAKRENYEIKNLLTPLNIGDTFAALSNKILGKSYSKLIAMDLMEANEITEESATGIESLSESDSEELFACVENFYKDCGLPETPIKEKVLSDLSSYRVIKKDNKIVSFAKFGKDLDFSARVSMVYTRPEYRGNGSARKVVNYVKNEILKTGKVATLHVDQANPISNHIYSSLGFKKIHSTGIYVKND